jgi:hypothetical protein
MRPVAIAGPCSTSPTTSTSTASEACSAWRSRSTARLAYLDYTDNGGDTNVVEMAVAADGTFDAASSRRLLLIEQPYGNHNGGDVLMSADGTLYVAMGDGGSGGDPERRASDPTTRLGKRSCESTRRRRVTPRTRCRPTTRSPTASTRAWPARRRCGRGGCATRGGSTWTRSPATCGSPTSARTASEEIDVGRRPADLPRATALNFGWSAIRGQPPVQRRPARRRGQPRRCSRTSTRRAAARSQAVRSYRGTEMPGARAGWYVFSDYCAGTPRSRCSTAPASAT